MNKEEFWKALHQPARKTCQTCKFNTDGRVDDHCIENDIHLTCNISEYEYNEWKWNGEND